MDRLTENKIVLVTRRTRLDDLVTRFNTVKQAQFYVEHLGADFSDYLAEHQRYYQAKGAADTILRRQGRFQLLDRSFLPNFVFGKEDTIVVLGQDGLVANTMKYCPEHLIIGVNPDPKRWDGLLTPFEVSDLPTIVPKVFSGRQRIQEVTMAKAVLNNGQVLYAVNDFFVGVKSHVSARYLIRIASNEEQHSSSGIIVSTGLGSTGWFKSLMAGAAAIAATLSEGNARIPTLQGFAWNADYLYFTVREPFPSKTSAASLVFGKITEDQHLLVTSQMSESGVIFSDGIEKDFLEFNSGTQATISLGEKKGHLVV
jgi:NAD kinase